jgi:hypothetical protein
VKHIAMARCIVPGGFLPSAQALPSIGNCIVGFQGVVQMRVTREVGLTLAERLMAR